MRIVMVCTGNTCRSPMAEALMRNALQTRGIEGVEVCSAGLAVSAGDGANEEAIAQMRKMGCDLRPHRATPIEDAPIDGALVLCMTRGHADAVLRMEPHAEVHLLMECAGLSGAVSDPFGGGSAAYAHCAEQMQRAIEKIADRLNQPG